MLLVSIHLPFRRSGEGVTANPTLCLLPPGTTGVDVTMDPLLSLPFNCLRRLCSNVCGEGADRDRFRLLDLLGLRDIRFDFPLFFFFATTYMKEQSKIVFTVNNKRTTNLMEMLAIINYGHFILR